MAKRAPLALAAGGAREPPLDRGPPMARCSRRGRSAARQHELETMSRTLQRFLIGLTVLLAAAAEGADPFALPPLPLPGPYAVECSSVMQDFNRLVPGEDVQLYWEGVPRMNGTPRSPADLLSDPANTALVTVNAPADSSVYGSFAGRAVPYVVVICHPTASANPRLDYSLPTGRTVPHMMRGSEPPLWPDATTRFPVLLFSHGYGGSPLSNDYINALTIFASFGYVVAAPFHTDAKFSDLNLEAVSDVIYLLTHLQDFLAMQALRPLALSAAIDYLFAQPQWRDRVDHAQVGAFGASMGGESVLLMAGAGLTTSIGQSWTQIENDTRLKAAVGYVPYFGQLVLPSFGRDQHGLDGVTLSYLAIGGTADTTAPIVETVQGVGRLAGPRELVALTGVKHGFDVPSTGDIFTWSITYLDAEVRGDFVARDRILRMTSVAGGGDDRILTPFNGSAPLNFGGLWWNAPAGSESGWGINFAHQGDTIAVTWLTYDTAGRGWWLAMTAQRVAANVYAGALYETRGPAFNAVPFDPLQVSRIPVGTGTLTFADANNGTFAYVVNGIPQTKNITREVFGPEPTCTFGGQPDLSLATNYQDLWWNAPAGSESGWGINLTQQGDVVFAVWFTYDLDGTPLWLAVTATKTGPATFAGDLFRVSGPRFDAFSPADVIRTKVGTATFTFADGNHATFAYSVQLAGMASPAIQAKSITREIFAAPGTACR